jgi:hypothetical protein
VLVASRKLRHYFQAHRVVVVTSFSLRAILHNSNAIGNIAKWATELIEFQLDFQPRHTIKSQVLVDFIVEWTPPPSVPGGPDPDSDPTHVEPSGPVFTEPHWTLFFDGSARQQVGGARVVLIDPSGDQVKYMVHLEFKATNNMRGVRSTDLRLVGGPIPRDPLAPGEGGLPADHQSSPRGV